MIWYSNEEPQIPEVSSLNTFIYFTQGEYGAVILPRGPQQTETANITSDVITTK